MYFDFKVGRIMGRVDISIRKQSINIQDIFKSFPAMDKLLKEDYNVLMEFSTSMYMWYHSGWNNYGTC